MLVAVREPLGRSESNEAFGSSLADPFPQVAWIIICEQTIVTRSENLLLTMKKKKKADVLITQETDLSL